MINFLINNYTLIIILVGTMSLGFINAVFGTFLVLKKQSLIGDALSHATLPGIVLAFLFTNSKNMLVLFLGASFSAIVALAILELVKTFSNIKNDALMAIILSSFFGFGQVLLLIVQTTGSGSQAGIEKFIFGQAATMLKSDVIIILSFSLFVFITLIIFYKELKLFIFDNEFYQSLGYNQKLLKFLLNILTVIVVTISIKAVGVVLMSALLITPAVISRQLSKKLLNNLIIASVIGVLSAFFGTYISYNVTNLPTGPIIVVCLSVIAILAMFFSFKDGIVSKTVKDITKKRKIIKYQRLIHAYYHNLEVTELSEIFKMIDAGYVYEKENKYYLTDKGLNKVERIIGQEDDF